MVCPLFEEVRGGLVPCLLLSCMGDDPRAGLHGRVRAVACKGPVVVSEQWLRTRMCL